MDCAKREARSVGIDNEHRACKMADSVSYLLAIEQRGNKRNKALTHDEGRPQQKISATAFPANRRCTYPRDDRLQDPARHLVARERLGEPIDAHGWPSGEVASTRQIGSSFPQSAERSLSLSTALFSSVTKLRRPGLEPSASQTRESRDAPTFVLLSCLNSRQPTATCARARCEPCSCRTPRPPPWRSPARSTSSRARAARLSSTKQASKPVRRHFGNGSAAYQ